MASTLGPENHLKVWPQTPTKDPPDVHQRPPGGRPRRAKLITKSNNVGAKTMPKVTPNVANIDQLYFKVFAREAAGARG